MVKTNTCVYLPAFGGYRDGTWDYLLGCVGYRDGTWVYLPACGGWVQGWYLSLSTSVWWVQGWYLSLSTSVWWVQGWYLSLSTSVWWVQGCLGWYLSLSTSVWWVQGWYLSLSTVTAIKLVASMQKCVICFLFVKSIPKPTFNVIFVYFTYWQSADCSSARAKPSSCENPLVSQDTVSAFFMELVDLLQP